MPELPEVESTRRAVQGVLEGRRIVHVEVARSRMLRRQPEPSDFVPRMVGRTIHGLTRRGKFLLGALSLDLTWVTHLGMSGRVRLADRDDPRDAHTNVVIRVGGGVEFRLVDPRTFGFVAVLTPEEYAESSLATLGPDALTDLPTALELRARLERRSAPIKALLLDQRILAGIGNIYADEALHHAGISPHRPGGAITTAELGRLRRAIARTLACGLRHGGTSLDDLAYLLPDGRAGEYLARLRAYGREGERCPRCGGSIVRQVLRGRSTFWCKGCQT